jgi:uncharacterized protein YndB with AHSA1/START domain
MTAKIAVSIRLKVPPDKAFELFTRDVDMWWRRGMKYRFHAAKTGRLAFEPGQAGRLVEIYGTDDEFEVGRILVWQPGERLRFTWRLPNFTPEQSTEVDISFTQVAEGTRLTLEHFGWATLPPDHRARHGLDDQRFLLSRAQWWDEQMQALRAMLQP